MNISTLSSEHYAAVDALMGIKAHTQKAIDRARATLFFIDVHGFFEANPAINQIRVQIDAEGGIGDEGQAYTSFSLGQIEMDVEPDVFQSNIYGFNDVEYSESGQIKLKEVDHPDYPLANDALVEAMVQIMDNYDGDYDWIINYLPYAVGDPEGRNVDFTVDRAQVNAVADVLLHRITDDSGRPLHRTQQQILDAQDAVIGWLAYS